MAVAPVCLASAQDGHLSCKALGKGRYGGAEEPPGPTDRAGAVPSPAPGRRQSGPQGRR